MVGVAPPAPNLDPGAHAAGLARQRGTRFLGPASFRLRARDASERESGRAASTEGTDTTMTTQKAFKQRVRARSARTGETYTAARAQLIRKADASGGATPTPIDTRLLAGVSEEAMLDRTGRQLADWFVILDARDAAALTHTEIARWLVSEHAVEGWWSQTITVAYERARGRRVLHQTAAGFSVGVTRTIAATPDAVTAAFRDPERRPAWFPDARLDVHAGYTGKRGRYDWTAPVSKVWVDQAPKPDGRTTVTVTHERLPDAGTVAVMKERWRAALDRLKAMLESS
jgi:uncharacterized protein YndB with AHSA1/START domain